MAKFKEPHKVQIPTVLSGSISLKCPICGTEEFLDSGPPEEEIRKQGFQHVIMGLIAKKRLVSNPVKFKHCANCGYVLQFMLGAFPQEDSDDNV